jgi:subtilisin family serine protease
MQVAPGLRSIQTARLTRPTALAAMLLVVCASGCGRGSAPTSPVPIDGPARAGSNDLIPQSGSDLRDITNEVVIAAVPGSVITEIAAAAGALVVREESGGFAALSPLIGTAETLLAQLGLDPRVIAAQINVIVSPAEDRQRSEAFDDGDGSPETYGDQPPVQAAEIGGAHRVTRGAGTRIAILDTGVEMTHPALSGHVGQQWDFVSEDADAGEIGDGVDNDGDGRIDEAWGHGTHVAGIAALVAPESQLLVARVLDGDGRGDVLSIAAAIFWARMNGADVINMSLGMLSDSPVIDVAIADAEAEGITCVATLVPWPW